MKLNIQANPGDIVEVTFTAESRFGRKRLETEETINNLPATVAENSCQPKIGDRCKALVLRRIEDTIDKRYEITVTEVISAGDGVRSILSRAVIAMCMAHVEGQGGCVIALDAGEMLMREHFGQSKEALLRGFLKLACTCTGIDESEFCQSYDADSLLTACVYLIQQGYVHVSAYNTYMLLAATCYKRMEFNWAENLHRRALNECRSAEELHNALLRMKRLHDSVVVRFPMVKQAHWPKTVRDMLMQ